MQYFFITLIMIGKQTSALERTRTHEHKTDLFNINLQFCEYNMTHCTIYVELHPHPTPDIPRVKIGPQHYLLVVPVTKYGDTGD